MIPWTCWKHGRPPHEPEFWRQLPMRLWLRSAETWCAILVAASTALAGDLPDPKVTPGLAEDHARAGRPGAHEGALSIAYTVAGLTGARWISRISPWCTLATGPLSQAIVAASQLISAMLPPSAASPRQKTRLPFLRPLDSAAVIDLSLMPCHRRAGFQPFAVRSALRCAAFSSFFLCFSSLRASAARLRSARCRR